MRVRAADFASAFCVSSREQRGVYITLHGYLGSDHPNCQTLKSCAFALFQASVWGGVCLLGEVR